MSTLESVFPEWKNICDKYDEICCEILQNYSSKEKALKKEESITWEQTALELIVTSLLSYHIPFEVNSNDIQKIIRLDTGIEKEIDFAIRIRNKEIYFGVTCFEDSEKDLSKDHKKASVDIKNIKYSDGTFSERAKITSFRPQEQYLNRKLAVRVAREGKHQLASDYIYIAFSKSAQGFGGGLSAISENFSFSGSQYTYPINGITGLAIVGSYVNIQPEMMLIESEKWIFKTIAFPHASPVAHEILIALDNLIFDMRAKFEQVRKIIKEDSFNFP